MTENEIGKMIVDAAVKVHMALGPGLLEQVSGIRDPNKKLCASENPVGDSFSVTIP